MPIPENSKPSPQRLAKLMADAGIAVTPEQRELFWRFHRFLREKNEELNMTRIHEFDAMVLKLYIDSALVGNLAALPSPLLDIGTGAGFPGIPLAILNPDVKFILSEGRRLRNEFLRQVVELLALGNVTVLGHRVAPEFEQPVAGVITRAVEPIADTLHRVLLCLQTGGKAIFMKGPECDAEIEAANRKFARYFQLAGDREYRLGASQNERRLVTYERTSVPAPRAAGGETILSADNPRYKRWRSLLSSRGTKKAGLAITGGKAALEILENAPEVVETVLAREGAKLPPEAVGFDTQVLARPLFEELGAAHPALIVRTAPSAPLGQELPDRCVVLGLTDPEELGETIRAAVLFGWCDVVLTVEAANPFHPEALRRAGAAAFRARFFAAPATDGLPETLTGAYRLEGPAAPPESRALRIFMGPQETPRWPALGRQGDLAASPATALAAALFALSRAT